MEIRLVAMAFLIAVGCDSSTSICALTNTQGDPLSCIEYADTISESNARSSCEGGGGSWQEGPCADNAVASCVAFGSTTLYYDSYLEAIGLTVAELRTPCEESGGEFTEL